METNFENRGKPTKIFVDGVLLTGDDLWKKVTATNFADYTNNIKIPINDVTINGTGVVENVNLLLEAKSNNAEHLSLKLLEAENNTIGHLNLKIEPDVNGILTYYVNKIPKGKVSSVKCNQIDGKHAYPIEFEIICNEYILVLKCESDKITAESKPLLIK